MNQANSHQDSNGASKPGARKPAKKKPEAEKPKGGPAPQVWSDDEADTSSKSAIIETPALPADENRLIRLAANLMEVAAGGGKRSGGERAEASEHFQLFHQSYVVELPGRKESK